MASITLPAGVVAPGVIDDPLTGSRSSRYDVELLDTSGAPLGALDGVLGGGFDWTANASIKGGGSLDVADKGQGVDWLNVRLKVTAHVGDVSWGLGVWIPAAPKEPWADLGLTRRVELLDRCSALAQDAYDTPIAFAVGTVVTDAVRAIIVSAGEDAGSITASTATLTASLVWAAGTSKLAVINDLLDAAGFRSLFADRDGVFRVEPTARPSTRPVVREFLDDEASILSPDMPRDRDLYAIPNKVIVVAQSGAAAEALTSVAINTDPASPYSYPSRGRYITVVETGVEATSQTVLDAYAARRLADLSSVTDEIEIAHAPVPLDVNDIVRLRRNPAGIDGKYVVTKTAVTLNPLDLAKSTIRAVTS